MLWLIIYVIGVGITMGILYGLDEDHPENSFTIAWFWPLIPLVAIGLFVGDYFKKREK